MRAEGQPMKQTKETQDHWRRLPQRHYLNENIMPISNLLRGWRTVKVREMAKALGEIS